MELPKRKANRLVDFDYSSNNAYFITICTKDKKCLLGNIVTSAQYDNIVGASIARPPKMVLSKYGCIVDEAINMISDHYQNVFVSKYVVMPNHIHFILTILNSGRPMVAPTVSTVVQQMKGYVSKTVGKAIWQKSFYDHIIRDEADYLEIWQYIDGNPSKWQEDKLYIKD